MTSWQKAISSASVHVELHWLCWKMNHGWHTLYINMPSVDFFFLKNSQGLVIFCMLLNSPTATKKTLLLKFRWSSFDPNKWLQRLLGEEPCSLWVTGSLPAGARGSVVSERSCLWLVAPTQSVHEVLRGRVWSESDSCDLVFLGHPQP